MVHLTSSGPGAGPSRTCSHPAPCQPPSPTASLALRASLCSGMCALALPACLPPSSPSRSWVTAVSAHAPPFTLASRLSSLALCLPVCLWSVLSVSLTLPSDLSWVSIRHPRLCPPHLGFQPSPLLSPSLGAPPFIILTLPFLQASGQGWSSPSSLVFTSWSSTCPHVCFPLLCTQPHRLPGDQLPPNLLRSPSLHFFL